MIGSRFEKQKERNGIDKYTVLMLHGEDFTDNSDNGRIITNYGVVISDNGKFGKCFETTTNANSYMTCSIPSLNDFTFEYWCNPTVWNEGASVLGATQFYVIANHSNKGLAIVISGYQWLDNFGMTTIPSAGMWTHVALTRRSGVIGGFLNGVKFAEGSNMERTSPYDFCVGRQDLKQSIGYFNGKIDEIRISNIARWTSDFTPPTEPYSVF